MSQSEQQEGHDADNTTAVSNGGASKKQQQRIQRKPGQSDSNRTLGSVEENVHKRLKTIETTEREESEERGGSQESDVYEHIKDAKSQHDAQTLDGATAEQQKEQPVLNTKEDDQGEEVTDQDVDMKPEDSELPVVSCFECVKADIVNIMLQSKIEHKPKAIK